MMMNVNQICMINQIIWNDFQPSCWLVVFNLIKVFMLQQSIPNTHVRRFQEKIQNKYNIYNSDVKELI